MDILLNIIVISLLGVTITFCWRLNNKIIELKDSRKDLGELVKTFDSAIIKTHKSIADLKHMSQTSSAELQQYVDKAGELISDLSFMTDTAAKLADRLENAIGVARDKVAQHQPPKLYSFPKEDIDEMIANIPQKTSRFPHTLQPSNANYSSRTKDELLNAVKLIRQG